MSGVCPVCQNGLDGHCIGCDGPDHIAEATEFVVGALGNLARDCTGKPDVSPYYAEQASRLEQAFRSGELVITTRLAQQASEVPF